jgi:hypothetical protein
MSPVSVKQELTPGGLAMTPRLAEISPSPP